LRLLEGGAGAFGSGQISARGFGGGEDLAQILLEQAVPIAGDITLAPAGSLLAAALAGLGPALLPDWLVDDAIAAGTLVRLLPDYAVTATSFDTAAWLVYPSRAYLPNKVRVMADFLREKLA
jgi:DNA-binding transcriptional LysR family regulator